MRNTKAAFVWIINILKKRGVRYQVTGGFAAKIYGAKRKLLDIDIDIPDKDFKTIHSDIKKYIIFGPKKWRGEGFEVFLATLKYKGQMIDLSGARGKLFNKKLKRWVSANADLSKSTVQKVYGKRVFVISKKELIAYKSKLQRRVDAADLKAIS